MAKPKSFIFRKITLKERLSLMETFYKRYKGNPLIDIGLKLDKPRRSWFEFVEQLTLTGLLWYLSYKTNNLGLKALLLVSFIFWFLSTYAYILAIQSSVFRIITRRGKFWWQILIAVIFVFGM